MLGSCTLCGGGGAAVARPNLPESTQSTEPPAAAPPNSAPTSGPPSEDPRPAPAPKGKDDGPNVLLAVAVALLIISLLATGYMVITVRGLNSKLADERAARSGVQDRITILGKHAGQDLAERIQQTILPELAGDVLRRLEQRPERVDRLGRGNRWLRGHDASAPRISSRALHVASASRSS